MANGVTHMMQSWRVTSTLGSPYKQCHISTGGYPCVAPETVLVCFHDLWPTQEIDLATCNHWILWQNTMLSSRLLYQWHLQPPWWSAPVGNTKLSAKYVKVIFDRAANKNHVNAAKALQFARRVQKPWLTIHFGHNGWMLFASIFGIHANRLEIICRKTMKWSKLSVFEATKPMYPTSD